MKEIWKDIFGYEGKYQISNLGRVKSLNRLVTVKATGRRPSYTLECNGKFLSLGINKKGYIVTDLVVNNIKKRALVHRLVALHFIPNPGRLDQVNHIDGNKKNNRIDNLEWVTNQENQKHAIKNGLWLPNNKKAVIGIDKDGNRLYFESAAQAGRELGINAGSINSICTGFKGNRYSAGGYKWMYADKEYTSK